jgi:hypothetical protein
MNTNQIFHFQKMLKNLDKLMAKAAGYADSKKFDVNVLTHARLAPDMFPLSRQIQIACDTAKFSAAYLSEQTAPKHEDTETTWPQLRERIQKVVTYLEGFKESDFSKASAVKVKPTWAQGQLLQAEDYIEQVAVPNFYFHITTVYALLRNAGVDIGKMDYLGNVNFQK